LICHQIGDRTTAREKPLFDILVRGETETERSARKSAEAPVAAFLVVEIFAKSGAAVIREHELPSSSGMDVARDLAAGLWDRPHRILFIDEANGICRDASAEIADLLSAETDCDRVLGRAAHDFCSRHAARNAA
jgi:hypothetical protein